jgi:hypothetical protein
MPRIVLVWIAACVVCLAQSALANHPLADVTGSYTSNWGPVKLEQHGAHVTGEYVFDGGKLDGTMDGNLLRFTWRERAGTGHGVFAVASDGELIGTWGAGPDDLGGGGWRLVPAAAQTARVEPTPRPTPAIAK